MNRIKTLCVTAIIITLAGCASVDKNQRDIKPKVKVVNTPVLGVITETSVGDYLLQQGTMQIVDAIELTGDDYRPMNGTSNIYFKHQESDLFHWYVDINSSRFSPGGGVASNGQSIKKQKLTGDLCPFQSKSPNSLYGEYNCYKDVKYVELSEYSLRYVADSFQRSLIYNGKVGSKINIAYREFRGNLSRPAFSNNVEYDMSESTTIAYKGAILEVIEYTNTKIRYKVIKNFR